LIEIQKINALLSGRERELVSAPSKLQSSYFSAFNSELSLKPEEQPEQREVSKRIGVQKSSSARNIRSSLQSVMG
jgi:hypothetical protein